MPQIPRLQRTVSREALPGVRLTAAETEASAGVGAELAGAEASRAAASFGSRVGATGLAMYGAEIQEERDRADSVAILNAERQLAEWENTRLYDPETGALNTRGKESFGLPEQVAGEYAQLTGHLEKQLGTDRQREMFQRVKVNRGMGLDLTLRRHVSGEMNRYEAEELKSMVSNSVSSAISNANDPERIGQELDRAIGAIKTHAPRLGLGPEQIERQVRAVTSDTHTGVIERLLSTEQDKAAQEYFDETKGQISGEAIAKIERALEEGSLRGESQRQADVIVAAGGTLTEQREKVKKIEDPKVRDQVMQRVEHEAAVKEREENEAERAVLLDAYNRVDKAGGRISAIPSSVWSTLSGNARSALRSYGEHIARGVPVQTDPAVYYKLMRQAADDPAGFASPANNLLLYKAKLDDGDFKQLATMQVSMQNGQRGATEKALETFRTNSQLLDDTLALYKIDPNAKPNTDEGRAIAQLRRLVDQSVEQQHALTGKKPTNQDVQEYIDRLLIPTVSKKGSWWNILPGGEPFYDQTKRFVDYTIADVPAKDREEIKKALERRQRTVTDQTILDVYITGQMRMRK